MESIHMLKIISLGLGRGSNPGPLALKPSECTTTPSISLILTQKNSNYIIHLLKILAFVATITAKNNYHGTHQKRENRFLTNQKAAVIILAQ
jgi:hypothetical protein